MGVKGMNVGWHWLQMKRTFMISNGIPLHTVDQFHVQVAFACCLCARPTNNEAHVPRRSKPEIPCATLVHGAASIADTDSEIVKSVGVHDE